MVKRGTIQFVPVTKAIRDPVTKFGGQPTWLASPQWPLSRETGRPMRFIGQVALTDDFFGSIDGRMAYLFMTDGDDYVDELGNPMVARTASSSNLASPWFLRRASRKDRRYIAWCILLDVTDWFLSLANSTFT
jgi:hypothetical protein